MLNVIIVLSTCLMVSVVGFTWGVYKSQQVYNLPKDEIIAGTREILRNMGRPKPAVQTKDTAKEKEAVEDGDLRPNVDNEPGRHTLPKDKLKIKVPDKVGPEKPPEPNLAAVRRQRIDNLTSEGDKIYNEAMAHLQNTFKREDNFDDENDLAAKQFSQAAQKYNEAQDLDPTSKLLQTKIREANQCIKICRMQARRK